MRRTWVDVSEDSGFGLSNLPYGVFAPSEGRPRVGVRVGEWVLDLAAVLDDAVFAEGSLNAFLATGRAYWSQVRARVGELLSDQAHQASVEPFLYPVADVTLYVPFDVADFVDFYASEHHASNVGRMFRPDAEPLLPNWKHLPVGYHGRAGTVVASGTGIVRPHGQGRPPGADAPSFGPSARVDFEAEVGYVVGVGSAMGQPLSPQDFDEHVFGVCLVNDWSARDIQAWESAPLGPFLGKSFATAVSAWVVPLEALGAARVSAPAQEPAPLEYLRESRPNSLALELGVELNGQVIAHLPYARMYWSPAQMLAHMTSGGARVRTGDLYASGTVSGPDRQQRGSLLELGWNGSDPVELADGSSRGFLADGDTVRITGGAPGPDGRRISLGEVAGTVLPARE